MVRRLPTRLRAVLNRGTAPSAPAIGAVGIVLLYHRVAELRPDTFGLCVRPSTFRHHMLHLRDEYHPISLEELAGAATAGRIPPRAVAVTLVDGTVDHFTAAAPILAEAGVPATFFVTTDRLGNPHESWWDTLERLVLNRATPDLRVRLNGGWKSIPTGSLDERVAAVKVLGTRLLRLSLGERSTVLRQLAGTRPRELPPRESHRTLTAAELRSLADLPGLDIGSHTVNHLFLPSQDLETQRDEILRAKAELEDLLDRPVRTLSYPHGGHDERTVEIARAAGCVAGVTVEEDRVRPGVDVLRLPRCEVPPGDPVAFAQRLRWYFGEDADG